jgi:hypothetical protein
MPVRACAGLCIGIAALTSAWVQGVLAPDYELYRDARGGASYAVPQGSEVEVFRKARAGCMRCWRYMEADCTIPMHVLP